MSRGRSRVRCQSAPTPASGVRPVVIFAMSELSPAEVAPVEAPVVLLIEVATETALAVAPSAPAEVATEAAPAVAPSAPAEVATETPTAVVAESPAAETVAAPKKRVRTRKQTAPDAKKTTPPPAAVTDVIAKPSSKSKRRR